jgi:hypothetical protein
VEPWHELIEPILALTPALWWVGRSGFRWAKEDFPMSIWGNAAKARDAMAQADAIGKSQAVIEFNMDGVVLNANQNFLGALGYALSDVQGKHHSMFMPPADRDSAAYREFWASLNRGEFSPASTSGSAKAPKKRARLCGGRGRGKKPRQPGKTGDRQDRQRDRQSQRHLIGRGGCACAAPRRKPPASAGRGVTASTSFRGASDASELWCAICTPENLEIPGLAPTRHPGMSLCRFARR